MRALRLLFLFGFLAAWFSGCTTRMPLDTVPIFPVTLTSPAPRLVYQRGLDNTALIPIVGTSSMSNGIVEARIRPAGFTGTEPSWQPVGTTQPDGAFAGHLRAPGGWYALEVRVTGGTQVAQGRIMMAYGKVAPVGVGEVFIVVGHSVAQGGDTNLAGATDDRVSTIAWSTNSGALRDYERTADPRFLPPAVVTQFSDGLIPRRSWQASPTQPSEEPLVGTHFSDGVIPAPFGHGTYFWAQFAERVARSQDVPVLLLNAAFGGTSLEHWAKSARGEAFEHSFVKSELRMPYVNLHHALRRYATVTGVRAILADQGQNDWREPDGGKVFTNYVAWVNQARTDLGFPELAVVVNRATPPGTRKTIREVQERVIREVPYCFPGPDYDTLAPIDRYDGVHLSAPGMTNAARLWAEALPASFFQQVKPYRPATR